MPGIKNFPPLYIFDDYQECISQNTTGSSYCLVQGEIIANTSNTLWNEITHFSSDFRHFFRHDNVLFGMCLEECRNRVSHLNETVKKLYLRETNFKTNDYYSAFKDEFSNTANDELLNECINTDFKTKYNLFVRTATLHCNTSHDQYETDALDLVFSTIVLGLIMLCVSSSLCDLWLRKTISKNLENKEYYQKPLEGTKRQLLVTFSLLRSWYKISGPTNNHFGRDLRVLECIRFFCMMLVITAHTYMSFTILPVSNTSYIEEVYQKFGSIILLNGNVIIQTFFTIAGFLLSVIVVQNFDQNKINNISVVLKGIAYRYLRYAPLYFFNILFNATSLIKIHEGPMWKFLSGIERLNCRRNWWANVFYINNYATVLQPCIQAAWFLATDFQLFIICFLILLIMLKFTPAKLPLRLIIFTAAFIIPGLIAYINELDGSLFSYPEDVKYFQLVRPEYVQIYVPFYTNLGSYFIGVTAGQLFVQWKTENYTLKNNKLFAFIFWLSIIIAVFLLVIAHAFYLYDFPKPSLWHVLYASIFKNFWGLFSAIVILGLCHDVGIGLARKFACHPVFRVLGRLTFAAYLSHVDVIKVLLGSYLQPIYIDSTITVSYAVSAIFITYIVSLVLVLLIELPFSALCKVIFNIN